MQVALCLALFHVTDEIIRMSNGFHGTRCSPGTEPKQGARTDCIQPMSCTDPEIYSGTALSLPRCPTVLYCSQLVVTNMQLLGTSQPETWTPAWTVVAQKNSIGSGSGDSYAGAPGAYIRRTISK